MALKRERPTRTAPGELHTPDGRVARIRLPPVRNPPAGQAPPADRRDEAGDPPPARRDGDGPPRDAA